MGGPTVYFRISPTHAHYDRFFDNSEQSYENCSYFEIQLLSDIVRSVKLTTILTSGQLNRQISLQSEDTHNSFAGICCSN